MNQTNVGMLAFLLVLAVMYISQTVGSANAQSQQSIQHACPPGNTSFSHGQCTVITTTAIQCPSGYTATGTGQGKCTSDACPPGSTFIGAESPNIAKCQPQTQPPPAPFLAPCPIGYNLQGDQCVGGTACPTGTTLQGQSCVVTTTTTRPGQGNQR